MTINYMGSKFIGCNKCEHSEKVELYGRIAYKCELVETAHFPENWACSKYAEVKNEIKVDTI